MCSSTLSLTDSPETDLVGAGGLTRTFFKL